MATNLCFLVLNLKRISCSAVNYLIYFYCFLLLLISVFSHPLTRNSALFSLFIDLKFFLVFWQRTRGGCLVIWDCPLAFSVVSSIKNSILFFLILFWTQVKYYSSRWNTIFHHDDYKLALFLYNVQINKILYVKYKIKSTI